MLINKFPHMNNLETENILINEHNIHHPKILVFKSLKAFCVLILMDSMRI